LGSFAGSNLTTGDNNIDIGNLGVADEANTIRIGTQGTQKKTFVAGITGAAVTGVAVKVNGAGRVGTAPSSKRFKTEIKPMDKASEAILALKPVTFRYKKEVDPEETPQFGLVVEDVEKVNPDLVARDADGKVYTVRYEAVNAMLLNEFLKEHRKVQELKSTQEATSTQLKSMLAKQEATIALQQREIKALTASLKKQASQIQKVSAQVELRKSAPQMVLNDQ
jgi:predicted ribosome quality control (RQC) complex YloA/Tae2 family protein